MEKLQRYQLCRLAILTANAYSISPRDLFKKTRKTEIVQSRYMSIKIFFYTKDNRKYLRDIPQFFGIDRTTIYNALRYERGREYQKIYNLVQRDFHLHLGLPTIDYIYDDVGKTDKKSLVSVLFGCSNTPHIKPNKDLKRDTAYLKDNTMYSKTIGFVKQYLCGGLKKSINKIMKTQLNNYTKTLLIIGCARVYGNYHNLSLIPDELIGEFLKFAENDKFGLTINRVTFKVN